MVVAFSFVVVLPTIIGIFGWHLILRAHKWIAPVSVTLATMYVVLNVPRLSFGATGHRSWGALAGGVVFAMTALGLGWIFSAADYTRYLPREAGMAAVTGWTVLGGAAPAITLMTVGALLAVKDQDIACTAATDPIGALSADLPTWVLLPFLLSLRVRLAVISGGDSAPSDGAESSSVALSIPAREVAGIPHGRCLE